MTLRLPSESGLAADVDAAVEYRYVVLESARRFARLHPPLGEVIERYETDPKTGRSVWCVRFTGRRKWTRRI